MSALTFSGGLADCSESKQGGQNDYDREGRNPGFLRVFGGSGRVTPSANLVLNTVGHRLPRASPLLRELLERAAVHLLRRGQRHLRQHEDAARMHVGGAVLEKELLDLRLARG